MTRRHLEEWSPMSRARPAGSSVSVLALIAIALVTAGCGTERDAPKPQYAVYAEHSLSNDAMVPGWNARVFNTREVQEGQSISLDEKTGVVTLEAGLYQITANSLVNYYDMANLTTIPMSLTPAAGYARLRYLADATPPAAIPTVDVINASNAKALSVGTGNKPNGIPSFMETFLIVDNEAKLGVEHQVGDQAKDLYLQVLAGERKRLGVAHQCANFYPKTLDLKQPRLKGNRLQ
jgi:hypothetical protein